MDEHGVAISAHLLLSVKDCSLWEPSHEGALEELVRAGATLMENGMLSRGKVMLSKILSRSKTFDEVCADRNQTENHTA